MTTITVQALAQLQCEEGRRLLNWDHTCSNIVPEENAP